MEKHLFCTTIPHRNYLSIAVPAFQKSELDVIDLVSDVQDVVQYKASSEPRLNSLPQPIFHYSKVCSSPHKGFTLSRYCYSPGAIRYHYIEILPLAGLYNIKILAPQVLLECQRPVSRICRHLPRFHYIKILPLSRGNFSAHRQFPLHLHIATR